MTVVGVLDGIGATEGAGLFGAWTAAGSLLAGAEVGAGEAQAESNTPARIKVETSNFLVIISSPAIG
jgi:hypothetical protein